MRVVKIGGRAQSDPSLPSLIREAWHAAHRQLCIVHGGGDEVSALQGAMGRESVFVGGRRVTSRGDIELLRMVLSGSINKRLVSSLNAAGVPAVGLSGEDGRLIRSEPIDLARLGLVGKPVSINSDLLRMLTESGAVPVISPVGYCDSDSHSALNVNGDDAAAAIAVALDADELMLVADVEGVRDSNGRLISSLCVDSALDLVASGVAAGGMAAKLESAISALASGVSRVRVCSLSGIADTESGTFIIQSAGVTT